MNIIELELLSDNLAATEVFYRRVFGLEPYFKEVNALMCFKIGGTELIFKKSENLKPVYHFAIDVPNNRFEEAHTWFRSKTNLIDVEGGTDIVDFANWQAKSFYFYDNNGNIAEIITRYPKKSYDPEPFSPKTYISVSEIGMVTQNVTELANQLIKEEGFGLFMRQPRQDDFTALGDDDGLLLVSQRGRNWFPTAVPARHFPVRAIYMDNGNLGHIIV